jgi:hypothetical protein
MSCSSVNIMGSGDPVTKTPSGAPLLIANLQYNPSINALKDDFWASCHTNEDSSILYPESFGGINAIERALVALNPTPFHSKDISVCASNNADTLKKLRLVNLERRQSDTAAACKTFALRGRSVSTCETDDSSRLEITTTITKTDVDMDANADVDVDVDVDVHIIDIEDPSSSTTLTAEPTLDDTLTTSTSSTTLAPEPITSTSSTTLTAAPTFGDTSPTSSTSSLPVVVTAPSS